MVSATCRHPAGSTGGKGSRPLILYPTLLQHDIVEHGIRRHRVNIVECFIMHPGGCRDNESDADPDVAYSPLY